MRKRVRRVSITIVATLACGLVGLSAALMWFEETLIYFPTRGGHVTGPGEDVWLRADDGVKLHARHIATSSSLPTLLYLHGNGGDLASRSDLLAELARLPANVLALDYRGYGRSEGKPSEAGLYRDALAAYNWLIGRESKIVVLGESLGGGPACYLGATQPVGALILQSTFTSIADMAALSFPWLPTRLLVRTRFDNLARIRDIRAPKLIVHSRADEVIPFEMGQRLFAAAPEPKQALWLTRAHHNDATLVEPELFYPALRAFLERYAAAR